MLDRRINKLKENLMRQADEVQVVRHLVDANPRGDDMLGEVCRAAVLLHPSASFEQALTLARTMAYIVYIDDYLEEEHPELGVPAGGTRSPFVRGYVPRPRTACRRGGTLDRALTRWFVRKVTDDYAKLPLQSPPG